MTKNYNGNSSPSKFLGGGSLPTLMKPKRILVLFLALLLLCVSFFSWNYVCANTATYTTDGYEWVELSTSGSVSTYGMDTDGDGEYEIKLVMNGSRWDYYFDVADDTSSYYVYETLRGNALAYDLYDADGNRIGYTTSEDGEAILYNNTEDYEALETGELDITKKVMYETSETEKLDPDKQFVFKVVLSAESDSDIPFGEAVSYGDYTFVWDETTETATATILIKNNETVKLADIPANVTYHLEEITDGYETTWTGTSGTIVADKTVAETCTNLVLDTSKVEDDDTGALTISKDVQEESETSAIKVSTQSDDTEYFSYRVVFTGLESSTTYDYVINSDGSGDSAMTLTSKGDGSAYLDFELADTGYITFAALPLESQYQVTEYGSEGYTASYSITSDGTITQPTGSAVAENKELSTKLETIETTSGETVAFINTYKSEPVYVTCSVSVTKEWTDGNDEHTGEPLQFSLYRAETQEDADADNGDLIRTVTLDGETDDVEVEAWTYTFAGLEMYPIDALTVDNYNLLKDDGELPDPYVYYLKEDTTGQWLCEIVKKDGNISQETGVYDAYEFTVTNTPGIDALPKTGGYGKYAFYIIGGCIACISLAIYKRRKIG